MPKWLFTVLVFAKISVKRYFRDRLAIFFTVAFPLIFLLVFGALSNGGGVSFHIGLINQSGSAFAQKFVKDTNASKMFKVDNSVTTLAQAKDKMSKSEIDATLVLPPSFGVPKNGVPSGQALVYYDENNYDAAQTIESVIQGELEGINTQLIKISPPLSVTSKSTNAQGLTKMDYTVSGLLGFAIIGLGIFGPVNYFPEMKKQGVLRRLHITPLRVWQFFVSSVLSNAVIGLFSIAIMLLVASVAFGFHMVGNYFELAVFIILGILSIFGIGLAIGGWAKNEQQAAPLANVIVFPMMFLSGTFFPRYAMPVWLQHVSAYLPLTPIIDGIRMIATEGDHLTQIGPQLGWVVGWTVVIYAIAFRVFRWE
ncbi:MAG TPA: ABC transporter permease [Candidatus Nitrosopolaris sp.]|nr:ABC transporter permease [Candidatus Nitrosopolaris sp.]